MVLSFFRRKKRSDDASSASPAAPARPEEPVSAPEPAPAGDEAAKPKRRRGTRGGRGRTKKPAETATEAKPAARTRAKAEPKPRAKAEPKPRTRAKAEPKADGTARRRPQPRRRQPQRRPPLPPAKRELLTSVGVSEQRVAVLEDGRVAEVYLERPERRSIAGNIYKGVVDNVLPGMEAAFVEIGLEKNGFLYVDEIVGPELEGRKGARRIQDLISRGQEVMVQAVKDPMKSKGARLTTEISLPGRFVVFTPLGEGFGVSRRLADDERNRLRDIVKALEVTEGGVIIRTAAEGASAEDVERDLVFLQRLWKTIAASAKSSPSPSLVYQEAELPLRVVRDLFTSDFEIAYVDDERTHKRIVGYLKKTSPHMVDRVIRYRDKEPLFEKHGVDDEIRSTLSRRVDLPSGGYLIFDYAEAFTVIDVNTGRFVGSRSKSSGGRLEDTITKNNLEAVKEVVRQLRLRDIGGIIVIDFIDMANPKNRELVEEALKTELERDRTKTYVVEISPLGLVEMTRQNVTEGPREILTRRCPTCGGDGFVFSEASAAVEVERKLRALVAGSRSQAFRVELNARVASILIGAGATRLEEIERQTKRRFLIEPREGVHLDHVAVLAQGKLAELAPEPVEVEGKELEVKLVEVGLHDPGAGIGKLDGREVVVADAAKLVGKKVKVRVNRVVNGAAYAVLADGQPPAPTPITAESEAEKPTRAPRARKKVEAVAEVALEEPPELEAGEAEEDEQAEPEAEAEAVADGAPAAKKRTRRGSRGGRGRSKKPVAATAPEEESAEPAEAADAGPAVPRIHMPPPDLGQADEDEEQDEVEPAAEGEEPRPKKRTRRGTRGGRRRKKRPAGEVSTNGDAAEPAPPQGEDEPEEAEGSAEYVPMAEWLDDLVETENRR